MNFDNWSAPRLRARVQELEEMLGDIDDAVDEFREENEHGTLFVVQEVVRELVSKKAQLSVLLNSAKNVPACLERYLGYVWLGWAIDANYNDDKGVVDELRAALAALAALERGTGKEEHGKEETHGT